ncbi:hypothetical protein Spla01_06563 [Streptomyces platensis]|uniref:Uncharacterized protein n=1 Tax=Streptomyces platensis TaxID=58346 RepID=A0ABX3Y066_STRPT|nr:hypothetical protein [Streptomyces platensis]OSY46488.1 hypothetical protein BG653_02160 [Streptomyces platensis]
MGRVTLLTTTLTVAPVQAPDEPLPAPWFAPAPPPVFPPPGRLGAPDSGRAADDISRLGVLLTACAAGARVPTDPGQ